METLSRTEILSRILRFFDIQNIPYVLEPITWDTFLPGVDIRTGVLVIDSEKLAWPGDLLHEAGHLAVMEPAIRREASGDLKLKEKRRDGEELAAIAWSYAAAIASDVPATALFHAEGYKGEADILLENYTSGSYPFLPLLVLYGLTCDARKAAELNVPAYPHMLRWMR